MLTKVLKYRLVLVLIGTLVKDDSHPVKLAKTLIRRVKHVQSEDFFPIEKLNRFFTISAKMVMVEWNAVKNNPVTKKEFQKKMHDLEKEAVDEGYLKSDEDED